MELLGQVFLVIILFGLLIKHSSNPKVKATLLKDWFWVPLSLLSVALINFFDIDPLGEALITIFGARAAKYALIALVIGTAIYFIYPFFKNNENQNPSIKI